MAVSTTAQTGNADANIHTPEMFRAAYAARNWRDYRWLVAVCVQHAEPGLILDVGAGLGFFVEACARYGLPSVGLEGAASAVQLARSRYTIDVCHHYLSRPFPLSDGSATAVVCNQTIEHLSPTIARHVLAESYRVLRPGGLLVIYSPCAYEPTHAAEPGHINLYTPSRLRREVLGAGFAQYRALDFARPIFGTSRWARLAATIAFRVMRYDRLSASANCIAYRPKH